MDRKRQLHRKFADYYSRSFGFARITCAEPARDVGWRLCSRLDVIVIILEDTREGVVGTKRANRSRGCMVDPKACSYTVRSQTALYAPIIVGSGTPRDQRLLTSDRKGGESGLAPRDYSSPM